MAINFPNSPSEGDTHTHTDGKTWTYSDGSWSSAGSGGGGGSSSSITDGQSTLTFDSNNNISIDTSIIPDANAAYDLGSAEYKIRHLFLSDNSVYFGNENDTLEEMSQFSKDNLDRNAEVYVNTDANFTIPAAATSPGKKGNILIEGGFMYVCIRTSDLDDGIVNWVRTTVEQAW